MASAMFNITDYPVGEAPQRPLLRLVDPVPTPRMAPPSWMLAPPIPAEINAVSHSQPQQPYLPIYVTPETCAPPTAQRAEAAPYRNIREVPRIG